MEKSTLWTDTGADQNFQRDLGAIGPYEFQGKFVWTLVARAIRKARFARIGSRESFAIETPIVIWAAANGGVTNGGLRGVWPPFLEIGRNRPFPPIFCLFRPFPEGAKSTWEIQKTEEQGLFPQISSDLLKPPSLKPPFAALQVIVRQDDSHESLEFPIRANHATKVWTNARVAPQPSK